MFTEGTKDKECHAANLTDRATETLKEKARQSKMCTKENNFKKVNGSIF